MAFPPDEHRNLNAFDPASWIAGISAALIAAGARRVRSLRPSTVSFEWPVASGDKPQSALPLEIEHQEGGTLVLVKQGAWRLSVTEANRRLVALMAQQLRDRRSRGDNGLINIQWQHTPAYQTDVPVSVDDFVQMDTADWLERLLASVRRHEQLFTVLDPLVQQAAAGVFEPGRAHVVVHALAMRLAEPASAAAVAFDPASWSGVAGTALTAAGAQHVLPRPTAISLEWPVVPPVRRVDDDESGSIPLEVQQQDGGTLIVVALFAWRMSVTDANKRLVELIARELCHASHRADNGFLDINWQYNDEGQRDAPFSLDDYVHAETLDWVDRLLASARRLEQIFRALDPLVQQAAAGVLDSGRAHVVVRDLAERLSGRSSAEAGGAHETFPAITMERFDDGVLRAIKLDAAPEVALEALDHPLLATVDEVSVYFEADAVTRWLAGSLALPRRLQTVDIFALDADKPALVCALLAPFQDCTHLSLQLDDKERFRDVVVAGVVTAVPAFAHLEVLEIDFDADAAAEKKFLDLLFTHPMPKLRRFALNSHGKRSDAWLTSLLKRLPDTVTELGLWQQAPAWTALREKLLSHEVMGRLTAVGVRDDIDEISDPRLDGKQLFGPRSDVCNLAHDLHAVGRHHDVVALLGPLRWKTRTAELHYRYAMSLAELDQEAGLVAWRAVLAIDPKHAAATHNLANQLVAMDRLEEAYPVVVDALALSPDEAWMLRCLAVIWQHRGDTVQTGEWSRRFVQAAGADVANNDNVDGATRYVLACAQMWVNEREFALESCEEAIAAGAEGITPDVDVEWDPVRDDPRWQRLFLNTRR